MKHHTKDKGDIAVTKVIADLTEKGYDILLPISEHLPFDLIAYKDNISARIQCKYTVDGIASSKTSWADKNGTHSRKYQKTDFDYFGLYLPSNNICVYPSSKFMGHKISTELPNSGTTFYWYEDFFAFTDIAIKKSYKDFNIILSQTPSAKSEAARINSRKVIRPSKEELEKLLWQIPTVQIAAQFGVSDVAIAKWAKSYNLPKPPRGYWAKLVIPEGVEPSFTD